MSEKISMKELKRFKRWYAEELKKRDDEIEHLKKENLLLLKTSLKQSERNVELMKKLRAISKKKKHEDFLN